MADKKGSWTRSVIKVGQGRGFVAHGPLYPYVITAAHCLPTDDEGRLTLVAARVVYREERAFPQMFGPLNREPTVPAKVVFVDPISDLAVLGPKAERGADADAYAALLADAQPFPIARIARPGDERDPITFDAYFLSLDRQWQPCVIGFEKTAFMRFILGPADTMPAANILPPARLSAGMSGSPIVLKTGETIGVIVTEAGRPQPFLAQQLPVWLLDEMTRDPEPAKEPVVRTRVWKPFDDYDPALDRGLSPRERMRRRLDRSGTPPLRT